MLTAPSLTPTSAGSSTTLPPVCLLLEAFNPRQLGLSSGGPREAELLYEPAQLAADFTGLTLLENYEARVTLREGSFQAGPARMVRLLAQRPANSNLSTELSYSI